MSDDLISRQKAIDLFLTEGMITAAVYVERMPSAQPEQKWIPVEERLPKPNEYEDGVHKYYLIQNEFGDMMVAAYWGNKFGHTWWEQRYVHKPVEDKVIAYMPLPRPYERSEE